VLQIIDHFSAAGSTTKTEPEFFLIRPSDQTPQIINQFILFRGGKKPISLAKLIKFAC